MNGPINPAERKVWFASGKVTVGTISQFRRSVFTTYFVGKVRGHIVTHPRRKRATYKFKTASEARKCGLAFRETCQN